LVFTPGESSVDARTTIGGTESAGGGERYSAQANQAPQITFGVQRPTAFELCRHDGGFGTCGIGIKRRQHSGCTRLDEYEH